MKLSVVVPIFKDAYLAKTFINELIKVDLGDTKLVEIIFVIDGGNDEDKNILSLISKNNPLVKVIVLSRNFGQHIAISAGYANTSGDYICYINVDMQDPPSEILKLLKVIRAEDNIDIVYGLRTQRKDNLLKSLSSKFFNKVLNKLTSNKTPNNIASLRIMTKRFISNYNELTEKSRYIPGLETWIGFEKKFIPINHQVRKDGKSSYTFKKRFKMAIEAIVSFSDYPLKLVAYIGMLISLISFFLLICLIILKIYFIDFKAGYISTIAVIVFIGGIQIFVIGLASIYIGRVLREVQNRPLYLIKEKYNF